MNKFRKITVFVVFVEIVMITLCNVIFAVKSADDSGKIYRVEAQRVAKKLQNASLQELDLSEYETIVAVSAFIEDEVCNNHYVVEKINGNLYRIEYEAKQQDNQVWMFNVCLLLMLFVTIVVFWYISQKVLQPFHKMSELTYELAKGNLSMPIKAEKSKFFGKFLWGMDMLRATLEDNKERELELQKEKKTLILSLSHDIKTPLSAIDLYAKALSENLYDTEEKRTEALQGIARNVQEIKGYVNEIVTASREDFLNLEVKEGEFYLSSLLKDIEVYYKDKLSILHTVFTIDNTEDCLLKGDINRIIEVLQNIIENAIKYGDGIAIGISFDDEEDCKLISVTNTGCILKEEELPNLFESFYRGSNSQGVKGSGLGLYIAKKLMKKMDGNIFAAIMNSEFTVTIVIRKA